MYLAFTLSESLAQTGLGAEGAGVGRGQGPPETKGGPRPGATGEGAGPGRGVRLLIAAHPPRERSLRGAGESTRGTLRRMMFSIPPSASKHW